MRTVRERQGATLIDLLVSITILTFLFGGIYLIYYSILRSTSNSEYRNEAASAVNGVVEIVRGLPYEQVGVQGGVPPGILPPSQDFTFGSRVYTVRATVRNVDDPFDGTAEGPVFDTAPADYKLVTLEVSCAICAEFKPFALTSMVAPKNLESASSTGSLFVNVFDAGGSPVSGATVRIINSAIVPAIDFTDITNAAGILQLVGVPSSTQAYEVRVSKNGYSSDRTYAVGAAENPNPMKPHATVAVQAVTNVSFAIDRLSRVNILTSDEVCVPSPGRSFTLTGGKLIGTSPDVLKFPATTTATDAAGSRSFDLEWDTYSAVLNEAALDLVGTIPFAPFRVNPSSTMDFRFVVAPADPSSLLVSVKNGATGEGIQGAAVTLSRSGSAYSGTTGRTARGDTSWAGGAFAEQSGGMDADSLPGSLALLANASGTYPASEWLVSETFDFGGSADLHAFRWNGSVPSGTGPDAVRFQLAGNNDNATWNFAGPDGTAGTYYTATSSAPHASLSGNRYARYKVFLATQNPNLTPRLDEAEFEFRGPCVPAYQAFFSGLETGTYDVEVSAPGFLPATSSASVAADWQQLTIQLSP